MAFRTSHALGPQLDDTGPYYWDQRGRSFQTPSGLTPTTSDDIAPSYRLGNKEVGSDGRDYIHVTAAADLAADARVNIDEDTWIATANATGTHQAIVAVAEGEAFQARKFTL